MQKLDKGKTALVTGASSGIGREFARTLAKRGLNVILVARNKKRLDQLAAEIERMGSSAEVLAADLGDTEDLRRVEDRMHSAPPVDLFINNAAFGESGLFIDVDVEAAEKQIRINVIAPTRLAHAALKSMRKRECGGIINISSGTAFVPSLFNAVYSGTKAYVSIFSLTIAEELRLSGIHVLTVFPGFTRTEFQDRAKFDVSRVPQFLWQTPEQVVKESLLAYESKRAILIPGKQNKLAIALNHLVPYSLIGRVAGFVARLTPQSGQV